MQFEAAQAKPANAMTGLIAAKTTQTITGPTHIEQWRRQHSLNGVWREEDIGIYKYNLIFLIIFLLLLMIY